MVVGIGVDAADERRSTDLRGMVVGIGVDAPEERCSTDLRAMVSRFWRVAWLVC